MISILKKRREGQIYTYTIILRNLNAYYPRRGRIQLLTAFCPASTAIFVSRQGFATLLETTIPSRVAALHEIASCDSPKAVKGFSPFLGDSKVRIAVISEFRYQRKLDGGAVEEALCFSAKEALRKSGAGDDDVTKFSCGRFPGC
jgi:hypothetical protein